MILTLSWCGTMKVLHLFPQPNIEVRHKLRVNHRILGSLTGAPVGETKQEAKQSEFGLPLELSIFEVLLGCNKGGDGCEFSNSSGFLEVYAAPQHIPSDERDSFWATRTRECTGNALLTVA